MSEEAPEGALEGETVGKAWPYIKAGLWILGALTVGYVLARAIGPGGFRFAWARWTAKGAGTKQNLESAKRDFENAIDDALENPERGTG